MKKEIIIVDKFNMIDYIIYGISRFYNGDVAG